MRSRKYTLVIIDMQPYFGAARNNRKLINRIKKEIEQAKKINNHIMFVKFQECGEITRSLWNAARNYPHKSVVCKMHQDGGHVLFGALSSLSLQKTPLRVCGVNTNQCVEDTVKTIAKYYPQNLRIEVIANGCSLALYEYEWCKSLHDKALKRMSRRKNVTIDWS